jgi:hypothetical protein
VIVRSRVHSLDDAVDSVENMATTYEPVKIGKKYLRILILSSLDNLINSFVVFLIISYNAKKKNPTRLGIQLAYELRYINSENPFHLRVIIYR